MLMKLCRLAIIQLMYLLTNKYNNFKQSMQGGKDKKIIVSSKNGPAKKNNLQIDTNNDHDSIAKALPIPQTLLMNTEDAPNIKSAALNSPKALLNSAELHESEANLRKPMMQKKLSQKQQSTAAKLEQPKNSTNGFVSPKAALHKEKLLIPYASEKNLGSKQQKKEVSLKRIDELERIVEQSRVKQSQLTIKSSQLESQVVKLKAQNCQLLNENTQMKKKMEKYKISYEQTKKLLKQRIHTFNEESGEMQAVKAQIRTLEERVQSLLKQNQELKAEINKFSDYNLKDLSNFQGLGSHNLAASRVLDGSRVSQLYLKQSGERDMLQFTDFENMEDNLDLVSYISEAEESYLQQYKANVDIFDKIKIEYDQIVRDIQIRYATLSEQYQASIKQQAVEIYELENRIDDLWEKKEGEREKASLSLGLDEMLLRNQKQIATLNLTIYDLRDSNKDLIEDIEHQRTQCRFLSAQLDIERMKKKFKNENDKFEFNVVKLNLLNIIDKLKMQIDREKAKYNKANEKYLKFKKQLK